MSEVVLITGADGYVGRTVTERLLTDSDARLVLAVRADDRAELEAKTQGLSDHLGGLQRGRVDVVAADLRTDEPFAGVDPRPITHVVHTAAVTRFNVEEPLARSVNVEGTRKVVAFARRATRLRRLLTLSSVYSAGRHVGRIEETPHSDAGFVNHYEWSKWAGERCVLDAAGDLPVVIARLGTLLADDDTGTVVQQNAFHTTFRLVYYGLLSVIPGDRSTPVYLLSGSLARAALTHLLLSEGASGIYHVCPERSEVLTLDELIDDVLGVFERSSSYQARKLLRPLLCDRQAFAGLVRASQTLGASPLRQAVGSVSPFAEQLFLDKDIRNPRLREAFPQYSSPRTRELVRATAEFLVDTKWRRHGTRRAA